MRVIGSVASSRIVLVVCLIVFACAAVHGAEATLDVDKLKPGDKLEVEFGGKWTPAEFVEKINDKLIRVKRADIPFPTMQHVRRVRLAKSQTRPTKVAGDDNPFATPEEKLAQAAKKRTWSDASGKFKVEAILVRIEDGNVVLRREDGKEIPVPLARLGPVDRKYLEGANVLGAANPPGTSPDDKPGTPPIPVKPTDLTTAAQVSIPVEVEWSYQPAGAAAVQTLRATEIVLRPMEFRESAVRMLFLPSEKLVFAVSSEFLFGGGSMFRVQACDLAGRRVLSAGNFGLDVEPLAISPDGSLVVARTVRAVGSPSGELQLYTREGHQVTPLVAWLPYRHHASRHAWPDKNADPQRPQLDRDADVTWAEFLDAEHLMTHSYAGELALWKVPSIEPVYFIPSGRIASSANHPPAMSADKKHFAVMHNKRVALLRSSDGETVGLMPADMANFNTSRLAWSDDGTKLAQVGWGRIRVWTLTNHTLLRDFPLEAARGVKNCAWVDNKHLVLDGRVVVDVERRIPLTTVGNLRSSDAKVLGGMVWNLGSGGGWTTVLSGTRAIPRNFKDPAGGKSAEELLVIRPGMEVAVELPAGTKSDGSDPRSEVIARLEKNGMKVVPQSDVRLVGTLAPGKTQTIQYTSWNRRSQASSHSFTEQVLTLSYIVDGETVWKHERRTFAPSIIHLKERETIGQALSRARRMDVSAFGGVWIPAHIARLPVDAADAAATPSGG